MAFISYGSKAQRQTAGEPDLKRELKMRRHPNDVCDLIALYDTYMAAIAAMVGIANQPRSAGVGQFIDGEWGYLMAKAWTVAEHLKGMHPTEESQREFVRALTDCAFEMDADAETAFYVMRDALGVEVAPD
ncbi:MAG: hypothetical protein JO141_17615 [Bradyrhizobium sp.]|nr:hypothetical protein [Bradyrhizobium sp.]